VLAAAGINFPQVNHAIPCPQHKTRVGPLDSDSHFDFLTMVIFVLASMCLNRWLYLEQPAALRPPALSDDWTPPLE
jgi:hypothetical protein